ncbi:putative inorganic phosphate cotransporter isoform X1 [Bactrocera tryoni]|uniref:putative inorganic phosphate cotransporter isoform X1 n=1 Tax=Bactrocera tryoni TaxID=59916 RepID=UPI001A966191|nr:putative inorganic phosphate cotransporter isoform X1 [Bactrocera tryoni]
MVSKDITAENATEIAEKIKGIGPRVGVRHLQSFLLFLGFAVVYMQRTNLSVAIVAMMDRNSTNPDFPEYDWSEQTKSLVISSYFWGYFLMQIPGGQLTQRFGGKVMLLFSVGIGGFLTIFTQLGDWQFICALRFLQGFCQAAVYPSVQIILARWAPPAERSILVALCFSGMQFGTVIIMSISGILATSKLGWPSIFYVSGGCGIIWSLVWLMWGADSPRQSKLISSKERNYIESALGAISKSENSTISANLPTPWLSIFTSVPFWVLLITHCAYNWGYWILLTQIPSYIKNVFDKDIQSNALFSALPYTANLVFGLCFCALGQLLLSKKVLSTNASRKIFNTVGMWIPMAATIPMGFVDADSSDLAVILLTLSVGFNSAVLMGFYMNFIELSPNFVGTLQGIISFGATLMSIIGPLVVGVIVTDTTNQNQWRMIFYTMIFSYFIGNLLFITLGSTKVQPWNEPVKRNVNREQFKYQAALQPI